MKLLVALLILAGGATPLFWRQTVNVEVENMFCACDPLPDDYKVLKANTPAGNRLVGHEVRVNYHGKDLFETNEFVTLRAEQVHYRVVGTTRWLGHTINATSVQLLRTK
jgi:hypothetical protein